MAPVLLPYLAGRPVTPRRFPEGVECPPHPPWVRTTTMQFPRTGKTFRAAVLDDRASLLWAANLSTLEVHPYLHRAEAPDRPTYAVFDLDPGPPARLPDAARVALAVRDLLSADGLAAWVKSSGAKGCTWSSH